MSLKKSERNRYWRPICGPIAGRCWKGRSVVQFIFRHGNILDATAPLAMGATLPEAGNGRKLAKKVSLIISGGLTIPGQFLKALALGADAVYIGTVAMIILQNPAKLQKIKLTSANMSVRKETHENCFNVNCS
jgi:hypothetical protein